MHRYRYRVLRSFEKDWHNSMVLFVGKYKLQEVRDIQGSGTIQ